jgi:hypothetical protein
MTIVPPLWGKIKLREPVAPARPSTSAPFIAAHPTQQKSTARRGTRRMDAAIRALIPPAMKKEEALAALGEDRAAQRRVAATAKVIWLARGHPIVQPVAEASIPAGELLDPVRRIGTYQGATNRIGNFVVDRDGYRLHLAAESRLEMTWLRELNFRTDVNWLHTQPFVLLWEVDDQYLWRVPDILARGQGVPVTYDVKPSLIHHDQDYFDLMFALTRMSVRQAGWRQEILCGMSAQRARNLKSLANHRMPNAALATYADAVASGQPGSVGEAVMLAGTTEDIAIDVLMHLIATKRCFVDLDFPLSSLMRINW